MGTKVSDMLLMLMTTVLVMDIYSGNAFAAPAAPLGGSAELVDSTPSDLENVANATNSEEMVVNATYSEEMQPTTFSYDDLQVDKMAPAATDTSLFASNETIDVENGKEEEPLEIVLTTAFPMAQSEENRPIHYATDVDNNRHSSSSTKRLQNSGRNTPFGYEEYEVLENEKWNMSIVDIRHLLPCLRMIGKELYHKYVNTEKHDPQGETAYEEILKPIYQIPNGNTSDDYSDLFSFNSTASTEYRPRDHPFLNILIFFMVLFGLYISGMVFKFCYTVCLCSKAPHPLEMELSPLNIREERQETTDVPEQNALNAEE